MAPDYDIRGPSTEILTKLELRASRQDWGKNDKIRTPKPPGVWGLNIFAE
jgi:hypothetical protein